MKIFGLLFLILSFTTQINSQTPQVPTGEPGKNQLPTPKVKPLAPADLIITNLTFVSIVFNADVKTYVVKVIASIKNEGEVPANKTQVQAFTKNASSSGNWKVMGEKLNVPYIEAGKSFSSVYTFKGSLLDIGTGRFDFRLKVDPGEIVMESDEFNNYSDIIIIDPRAH